MVLNAGSCTCKSKSRQPVVSACKMWIREEDMRAESNMSNGINRRGKRKNVILWFKTFYLINLSLLCGGCWSWNDALFTMFSLHIYLVFGGVIFFYTYILPLLYFAPPLPFSIGKKCNIGCTCETTVAMTKKAYEKYFVCRSFNFKFRDIFKKN